MNNLSIKDLIGFRSKSDRSKQTFVNNLRLSERENVQDGSGGDYWISSMSALSNTFKYNNSSYLDEKIEILLEKIEETETKKTMTMYQRNFDILQRFNEFDFKSIRPPAELEFLKKSKTNSIIDINGLQVKVRPNYVYSFNMGESDKQEVGAIWYVSKLYGLRKMELGMFTDIMYRYLDRNFSSTFHINPTYCISIDAVNLTKVSYEDINNGKIPLILEKTVSEIRNLL
jgi:hypothetical protein